MAENVLSLKCITPFILFLNYFNFISLFFQLRSVRYTPKGFSQTKIDIDKVVRSDVIGSKFIGSQFLTWVLGSRFSQPDVFDIAWRCCKVCESDTYMGPLSTWTYLWSSNIWTPLAILTLVRKFPCTVLCSWSTYY